MGPPGAGKGSLAQLCTKRLGWKQLSTGNLCRYHIVMQTEIGKEIDFFIKSGKLIPDTLMIEMVKEWLLDKQNHANSCILDGFPRTVVQAKALDELLENASSGSFFVRVINMILADKTVINRLMNRLICQNSECQRVYSTGDACDDCSSILIRRIDDTHVTVEQRLVAYHKHSHELINYYSSNGKFIKELLVEQPLDEVFGQFQELIGCNNL
jgi:adenylate kinase